MIVYYEDCLGLDFAINKKLLFCPYKGRIINFVQINFQSWCKELLKMCLLFSFLIIFFMSIFVNISSCSCTLLYAVYDTKGETKDSFMFTCGVEMTAYTRKFCYRYTFLSYKPQKENKNTILWIIDQQFELKSLEITSIQVLCSTELDTIKAPVEIPFAVLVQLYTTCTKFGTLLISDCKALTASTKTLKQNFFAQEVHYLRVLFDISTLIQSCQVSQAVCSR